MSSVRELEGVRDDDPRHIAIMEGWVRRIVNEVATQLADGICEEVGRVFLDAKTHSGDRYAATERRFRAIEAGLAELHNKKREP